MKPTVIIRMGASHWDARIQTPSDDILHFDFRKMDKKQRSDFHREFMNAFRSLRK